MSEKETVDLTQMNQPKKKGLKGPLTAEVELGGTTYTIRELPSKKNSKWRESVAAELSEISTIARTAMAADVTRGEETVEMLTSLSTQVVGAFDKMRELMFQYSPELKASRKTIEEESFDSEVIPAFLEVLKLGFPFGSIATRILDLSTAVSSSTQQ